MSGPGFCSLSPRRRQEKSHLLRSRPDPRSRSPTIRPRISAAAWLVRQGKLSSEAPSTEARSQRNGTEDSRRAGPDRSIYRELMGQQVDPRRHRDADDPASGWSSPSSRWEGGSAQLRRSSRPGLRRCFESDVLTDLRGDPEGRVSVHRRASTPIRDALMSGSDNRLRIYGRRPRCRVERVDPLAGSWVRSLSRVDGNDEPRREVLSLLPPDRGGDRRAQVPLRPAGHGRARATTRRSASGPFRVAEHPPRPRGHAGLSSACKSSTIQQAIKQMRLAESPYEILGVDGQLGDTP